MAVVEEKVPNEMGVRPVVKASLNIDYTLMPLDLEQDEKVQMAPPYTGCLLMAMYHYQRMLTLGAAGFDRDEGYFHGGVEPVYIQPLAGPEAKSFKEIRVNTEVIRTRFAGVSGKWYFYRSELNPHLKDKSEYKDNELVVFEIFVSSDQDPCEIYLHDSKLVDGRLLPGKFEVRNGDQRYAVFTVNHWKLGATPAPPKPALELLPMPKAAARK
jgi:hypothetical protein